MVCLMKCLDEKYCSTCLFSVPASARIVLGQPPNSRTALKKNPLIILGSLQDGTASIHITNLENPSIQPLIAIPDGFNLS